MVYCISVSNTVVQIGGNHMFMIDVQSKQPIFEQLSDQILKFISIGILQPNDKLPSVRSLASELGVNPNTVSKTYQELEKRGYVYSEKGKGCFVSNNEAEKMIEQDKLNDLSVLLTELKMHHIGKQAVQEVVDSIYREDENI